MRSCKRSVLGLLLTGALILPATDAFARRGEGGGRGGMMKELNLTDEQREKMKELRSGQREEMQAQRKEMQAAREALENALKGNASDKEVWERFDSLQKVQAKFAKERFEKVMAIRAILTPEQRSKFRGMMGAGGPDGKGKGMKRWGKKKGRHGPDEEEE